VFIELWYCLKTHRRSTIGIFGVFGKLRCYVVISSVQDLETCNVSRELRWYSKTRTRSAAWPACFRRDVILREDI